MTWSVMVKTYGGMVNMLSDLSEAEARAIMTQPSEWLESSCIQNLDIPTHEVIDLQLIGADIPGCPRRRATHFFSSYGSGGINTIAAQNAKAGWWPGKTL